MGKQDPMRDARVKGRANTNNWNEPLGSEGQNEEFSGLRLKTQSYMWLKTTKPLVLMSGFMNSREGFY